MNCEVRRAREVELAWVNERYDEVEFVHSTYDKEIIAIAEVEGQKAGIGRLVTVDDKSSELGGMYVFESFRGKGVATLIVEFLLENALPNRAIFCIPFTHLAAFYQQHGFTLCQDLEQVPQELLKKYLWCKEKYSQPVSLLFLKKEALKMDFSDVSVGQSGIGQFEDGLGVFAKRDFKQGEVVIKWHLQRLSQEEFAQLSEYEKNNFCHKRSGVIYYYPMPERYVNRSDNPNVYPDLEKEANIALRDIKCGEELSIPAAVVEDF